MIKRIVIIVILLVGVALISVGLAQGQVGPTWSAECTGEVRVRGATVECWQELQPPLPTQTATPTVEPGSTPSPTPTPPTNDPTATPTPDPGVVEICEQHDSLLWHDLYDEDRGCRYDHEHGDDPSLVNDVFGPAGAWFGSPGWEIGSPAVPAHEIGEGHRFWKTYVVSGLAAADNNLIGPDGSYIRSLRVQTHVATDGKGIKRRYHGFTAEIESCRPAARPDGNPRPNPISDTDEFCGIYRSSGTLDYGNLFLRDTGDPYRFLLPNEGDGQDVPILFGQRIHSAVPTNTQAVWYPNSWPGTNGYLDLQVIVSDGWSWADSSAGNQDVVIRQVGSGNGTIRQLHILSVNVQSWMPHDGEFSVDTFGNSDSSCDTFHSGCGLLLLEDWPTDYQIRYAEFTEWRHYDTSPAGETWIVSPN